MNGLRPVKCFKLCSKIGQGLKIECDYTQDLTAADRPWLIRHVQQNVLHLTTSEKCLKMFYFTCIHVTTLYVQAVSVNISANVL